MADLVASYGSATIDALVAEHAEDVSDAGIFLRTSGPIPVGKLVDFARDHSDPAVMAVSLGALRGKSVKTDETLAIYEKHMNHANAAVSDLLLSPRLRQTGAVQDRGPLERWGHARVEDLRPELCGMPAGTVSP